MPITPFHMGPAALLKVVGRRHFSFLVFGVTNAVIDVEVVYHVALGHWPMHNFLHTLLGVTVAAVVGIAIGKPFGEVALRWWNRQLSPPQHRWLGVTSRISWPAAVSGAILGAYSHILLDAVMHADVHPAAPWSDANPLHGWLSIANLHAACAICGAVGVVVLLGGRLPERGARGLEKP